MILLTVDLLDQGAFRSAVLSPILNLQGAAVGAKSVERSLAWWARCRRLVRDFEVLPETTESWVYLASIQLMLRRLEPS